MDWNVYENSKTVCKDEVLGKTFSGWDSITHVDIVIFTKLCNIDKTFNWGDIKENQMKQDVILFTKSTT